MRIAASTSFKVAGPRTKEWATTVPSSSGHAGAEAGRRRDSRLESKVPGWRAPKIAACSASASSEPKLRVNRGTHFSGASQLPGRIKVALPPTGPNENATGSQRAPFSSNRNVALVISTELARKSGFQVAACRVIVPLTRSEAPLTSGGATGRAAPEVAGSRDNGAGEGSHGPLAVRSSVSGGPSRFSKSAA